MMIRNYPNELWKEIELDSRFKKVEKFIISNYGRVIKESDGVQSLLQQKYINDYEVIVWESIRGAWSESWLKKIAVKKKQRNPPSGKSKNRKTMDRPLDQKN